MTASTLGYTPGTGANVATEQDSGGAHHQKTVSEFLNDVGEPTPIASATPMPMTGAGELMEAIEALRFAVQALTRTIGMAMPNASGQPVMEARQATAANLLMTASLAAGQTLATVTTLATLTNQSQIGGIAANEQIPALMRMQADSLRRNITVT